VQWWRYIFSEVFRQRSKEVKKRRSDEAKKQGSRRKEYYRFALSRFFAGNYATQQQVIYLWTMQHYFTVCYFS
jgi:hypothetical protein